MRILFMGTPEFAVPSLESLIAGGHELCGVFSQPDKPKNRGMKLFPTPIKACALTHNIPVFQPTKLRDGTAMEIIRQLNPELIVVAAYGRILPDDILGYPLKGCINVHSSLLPKYRGAAPINWAILNGETESGVTIMHMASELDAGDIILQERTQITSEETAEELYSRLALLGGRLLLQAVSFLENGRNERVPQDNTGVSLAPMLDKSLSPMDWSRSAHQLHCQVRGLLPWPVATTDVFSEGAVKIFRTEELDMSLKTKPGTVIAAGKAGIDIVCGDGKILRILELQAPGGRRMSAGDYLSGHPIATD